MSRLSLYLIDATALCYRAYYALSGLTTSAGQPTNAVYGFTVMLNKILREHAPEFVAVCFDVSRETFRQKKYAEYKGNRPPMPDGLSSQMPLIKEVIAAYGIALFEKEGYEADDVIATLAASATAAGMDAIIVSADKDLLQLVDEHTRVLSPGKNETVVYDAAAVGQRYGVEPAQMTDVLALMGDDVDNIPGIRGIGEKTAVKLVKEFGTVEKLIERIDLVKPAKLKDLLAENKERLLLNKELAALDRSIDIPFDREALRSGGADHRRLYELFKRFEFRTLAAELPVEDAQEHDGDQAVSTIEDSALAKAKEAISELGVYGFTPEALIFHSPAVVTAGIAEGPFFSVAGPGAAVKDLLGDSRVKKIGHDLKRLTVMLAGQGIVLDGIWFDTMLAAYLLDPAKSDHSLAEIAWQYLGKTVKADTMTDLQAMALIVAARPGLENALREKELYRLFDELEIPLAAVLARMECTGIKLDTALLKDLSAELEGRLGSLIEEIYSTSGSQFNINSPKQLREVLFEKLKLPVVKRTKTGPSTDEEVLRTLARSHALPALLLEYRQLMKLKTTYVDTLPTMVDGRTGRVHTVFNQAGTETGRLSSNSPNLQNIPVRTQVGRQIRRAVVAFGPQSVLVSCDYSQIELRILAHFSQDPTLIEAFRQDRDVHRMTAALIYGVEESLVSDQMRDTAKRVNFGIIYGLTSYGLARDLEIPQGDAQRFIDAYFLRYPQVRAYIDRQIEQTRRQGFVTTILNRRRYLPEINNKNQAIRQLAERQAVNTPIQGTASDLIKLAMIRIDAHIREQGLKSRMILQVHDELVFDVVPEESGRFVGYVKETMETVLPLAVPVKVDVKQGRNWLEMEGVGVHKKGGVG